MRRVARTVAAHHARAPSTSPPPKRALDRRGIILRGGGADEAPDVYRSLRDVLAAHEGTIAIEHTFANRASS